MPPFTVTELTSFFTNGPQIALTGEQCVDLATAGFVMVVEFCDFQRDELPAAFKDSLFSSPCPDSCTVYQLPSSRIYCISLLC